jgi:spermidine synthase
LQVLVIGGGDGGVLREVVKHDIVDSVTLVEIDQDVINVSKKYLPSLSSAYTHPKVSVHVGDGFEYLKNNTGQFDVIITDSSDPEGPAEALFQEEFFQLMHRALKPHGIICTQGT